MNLVVDRIINGIAICENLKNKKMVEIDIKKLSFKVHDGDVITFKNGKYILNKKLKEDRKKIILDKFNKVKNIR